MNCTLPLLHTAFVISLVPLVVRLFYVSSSMPSTS